MAIEPSGAPAATLGSETNNNNHDHDASMAALPNGKQQQPHQVVVLLGQVGDAAPQESRDGAASSSSSAASSTSWRLQGEPRAAIEIGDPACERLDSDAVGQTSQSQPDSECKTHTNEHNLATTATSYKQQLEPNKNPTTTTDNSTTTTTSSNSNSGGQGPAAKALLLIDSSPAQAANHHQPAKSSPNKQQDEEAQLTFGDVAKTQARRLSFLQGLLLRKWPYLALTICIMSSLIFGMLLSALTVYLMHFWGAGQCGPAALAAEASGQQHLHLHHHASAAHQMHESLMLDMLNSGAGGSHEFGASPGALAAPSSASAARSGPPVASLDAELSGRSMMGGGGAAGEHLHLSSGSLGAHLDGSAHPIISSAAAAAAAGHHEASAVARPRFQRLAQLLVPEHYDLFVWPVIGAPAFNFSGRVAIQMSCREPTDNITLHSLDLDISPQSVQLELLPNAAADAAADAATNGATRAGNATNQSAAPGVKRLSQDRQLQYSIVHLEAPLQVGRRYRLSMDFAGPLNDDLAGFYKIKYERQDSSEPTWIAATQFQATDARRAFPCFDEPLYKATFSIKIKHWKNMTALSNMPIIHSEESQDGLWITDTFAKTHRMSTYLVAYAVTNFESRSEGNISVWTRPGQAHTAEYALKIAGKILRHYENFFGIEYPLPKMDMIALPDFNAGAMENWGLITYRETAMLYDESSSSVVNKQRVATVVAHELAHQWFGNLVTPKWWDDLWLNEGFASYVEYIGVDHVEPHWRMLDQFVVDEIQDVLKVDCLSSSHQISIPVNNPDEISEIFDHISYSKGASIIRMMNHFLTEEVFKLGLQRYLRALKYNNAEQKDLWAHLTDAQRLLGNSTAAASGLARVEMVNVENVMNSWTLQTGFPLVTLTRSYNSDGNGSISRPTLDQVRFQPLKVVQNQLGRNNNANNTATGLQATEAKPMKWEIPITYTWKSDKNWQPITRLWLHQNDTYPVQLGGQLPDQLKPNIPDNEWILLNVQQVGYYRVNYDQRNWQLLIDQLQQDHKKIPTINRAQILDDLFDLVKSSMLDYRFALEATRYLKNEHDYLPWRSVLLSFSYIDDMLRRTPIYGEWNDYVRKLIEPFYNRYKDLDWTVKEQSTARVVGDNSSSRLKRQSVVNTTSSSATPTMDLNDVLEQYNQMNAITWACQVDQRCVGKAKKVFKDWRETKQNRIIPALRYAAYCAAIENGDKDDWEFLWHVYEKEQNASEKDRILRALGCSKEIWILSRYVEWIFDKTKPIRRQDGSFVFRMIAGNNYGRDIAFNYMREKWSTIKEYYGKTSFSMSALIRSVSSTMNTQVELNELQNFYESIKSDVGTGKRSFQLAIEEVEGNVYWRNNNYKKLEDWLRKENKSSLKSASSN